MLVVISAETTQTAATSRDANGRDALIGRFEWTRVLQIPLVWWNLAPIMLRKLLLTQGTEESYLTVMLAKFIAQIDLVLNSKQ